MRINEIRGLVIHELRPIGLGQGSDRRGPICDLMLSNIPNAEHAINIAVRVLQRVCSLLDEGYFWSDNRDKGPSEFTEQFEAWIDTMPMFLEYKAVSIRHKYWSQRKVDEFLGIILHLARLHGWEVEDRRQQDATHYGSKVVGDNENEEFLAAIQAWHSGISEEDAVTMAEGYADEADRRGICPWRLLVVSMSGMPVTSDVIGLPTVNESVNPDITPLLPSDRDAKVIPFPTRR